MHVGWEENANTLFIGLVENKFGLEEQMRRSYPGKTSLGPLRHSDLCCQSAYPFWRIYYVPAKKKSLTLKSVLHRVPPSSVLQEFRLGMTLEPVYF